MVLSAFMAAKLQKVFKSSNFKGRKVKNSTKVIAVSRNILGLRPSFRPQCSLQVVDYCDITELVKRKYSQLSSGLLAAIASVAKAPKDAILIHSNIALQDYIEFVKNEDEDIFDL